MPIIFDVRAFLVTCGDEKIQTHYLLVKRQLSIITKLNSGGYRSYLYMHAHVCVGKQIKIKSKTKKS